MEIVCQACSTRLTVPDDRLPKNVPSVTGKCPKCQGAIIIRIQPEGGAPAGQAPAAQAPAGQASAAAPQAGQASPAQAPAAAPPAQAPAAPAPEPAPEPPPEEDLHLPDADEHLAADRKLAMACFDKAEQRASAKAALEGMGYFVHAPENPKEAVLRLRHARYEALVVHQAYGGSEEGNPVLCLVQPMPMTLRRHMCVGLVGESLRTLDNMAAFARSVNLVVAETELDKLPGLLRAAIADNDQFYRVFREALHAAGRG